MTTRAEIARRRRRLAGRHASRPTRIAKGCGAVAAALVAIALVAVCGLYLKLAAGPITLGSYSDRLEAALAARLGAGWRVSVEETAAELKGGRPAIRTTGLQIRNPLGVTVVRAPYAIVSLNPFALLFGTFSPREIELRDLHLQGVIAADGSLAFSTSGEAPPIPAPALPAGDGSGTVPPAPAVADEKAPSIVSAAASSLVRPLVAPSGIIGGLDGARLVDARLTLVGSDGRERASFDGVDAVFEKVEHGDRRFEIDLRGPRGAWRVGGTVRGAKGNLSSIEAHGVPVSDILLLTGLSKAPVTSDIRLSGTLSAGFARDRLAWLQGKLNAAPGAIEREKGAPVRIDSASAEIAWDEAARRLDIGGLKVRGDGTDVGLKGRLAADERGVWQLSLDGRDVLVAGLDKGQPPFKLGTVEAGIRLEEGRLDLDRFAVRGDGVDISMTGSFSPGASGEIVASRIEAKNTDARKLVRLWPDFINTDLRTYLASRLVAGKVDSLSVTSSFDATDLKAAMSDAPFTDGAVAFEIASSGIGLNAVDGLPPLRGLTVQGKATGTSATLTANGGAIEMPDGRRLGFTDASYVHMGLDKKGSAARIGFRVRGGLDALVSFFRSPLIRDAGVPDVDPASVKGNVDLKAQLPYVPGALPPLAQLGIELSGTLTDVSADKLPGRERIDDGTFAVQQDSNALSVKGEAKLGGAPATFDLRMPKTGGGELNVTATLDEAARARRSLPVAPALSGPIGVKVNVPLGAKAVPRVEADLSRATIDGLVPGWQKPAGKPGRVAFAIVDPPGPGGTELRDFVVDSGTVQMKGTVALSSTGGLDKADLAPFRLSPGDDMRAQLERSASGYRIALRGNNADARPLLRWVTTSTAKPGKDPQDLDVDANLAILSGFNDEAMTSVTVKASTKAGEVRGFQFGGKFRAASVEAGLAKKDAGAPIVSVRSQDAGAMLRFLDLYRRMSGGRLALEARSSEGVQQGEIVIEEFGLKGEPALRRIVAQSQQQVSTGTDERGVAPISRQDVDQVLFTRLTTGFRRAGSRMDYMDAVIYGPQVGFNLSGWVDTARDRLDVNGTFVPAYILNNAFSQLPVIGLILGGGRTEGLIAVDFRVAGALSGPIVTVNPLTAVAPGILRKLFGWMMTDGQSEVAAPAAAERKPRRPASR